MVSKPLSHCCLVRLWELVSLLLVGRPCVGSSSALCWVCS